MQYRNTVTIGVPAPNTARPENGRTADYPYDFDRQNESRADLAETALIVATDRAAEDTNGEDVWTDVSDLLANIAHFCDRAGIDFHAAVDHAYHAYEGDSEDGPDTERDYDRFPDPVVEATAEDITEQRALEAGDA